MTHQDQPAAIDEVMELLAEHGSDGLAQAIGVLRDELMKRERTQALGAAPHRRSEARKGSANGSKPETRHTPMGPIAVRVPQARGLDPYASALERGVRSERASKPAVAERDGPGVSTGKGAAIAERPRGSEVTRRPVVADDHAPRVPAPHGGLGVVGGDPVGHPADAGLDDPTPAGDLVGDLVPAVDRVARRELDQLVDALGQMPPRAACQDFPQLLGDREAVEWPSVRDHGAKP
ncbi:Transposase, Mutator family [Tautonia plasticadhaerens]|uniref:Transposase, Mutator family n=1 Tax=Tautonia plasticadhaerens TaxID=2527974 RepID=A0A518H6J5_9BACT|nr:Transposase, Mutator family [Tautonia plasticadhaerens]